MGGKRRSMDEDEGLASTGRRSYPSDGVGETIKQCWRMNIGQTPVEGQRHGYAILLQMGVRGARNERGNIIERCTKR